MTSREPMGVEQFIEAGLYDPDAPGAEERLALLRLNAAHGVSIEEMVESREEGRLALLAGRKINLGEATPLSLRDIATRTKEPMELVARIWRAVGFAEPDPDEPMYTEASLELLDLFRIASEIYGEEVTLQLARVIGSSISRIADAEVTAFVQNVAAPLAEERQELAIAQAHVQLASLNPPLAMALDLAHRYHCEAARCGESRLCRAQDRAGVWPWGSPISSALPLCPKPSPRASWLPPSVISNRAPVRR
jgi:hypothetical protein